MLVYNGKKFVPLDEVLERPEILGLVEDLGLELLQASRYRALFRDMRFKIAGNSVPPSQIRDSRRVERPFIARFAERNHHYKDFRNVYQPDNNQTLLSFDW